MSHQIKVSGGFDCEFVEKQPQELQSECPVCLLLLREPFLVSCCGYSFCKVCIEKVKYKKTSCPNCLEKSFKVFPNKGLQRSLYEYKVYCSNRKQGCQWTGNLSQFDSHINSNPPTDTKLDGCQFVRVKCCYCLATVVRSKVRVHEYEECLKRPYSCCHCKNFASTYQEVTLSHWSVCGCYPIVCTNKCGTTLQRQMLGDHITNHCPETEVDCKFKHFGCNDRQSRKHLQEHMEKNLMAHMEKMSQVIVRLEEENKLLRREIEYLKTTNSPTSALVLVMNNLNECRTKGKPWISRSFFAHGYKLRLQVYVNDHGHDGSLCTTIFVCMVKGNYDEILKWPFQGTVVVELLTVGGGRYRVLHTERIAHKSRRVTNESICFGQGVTTVHPGLMNNIIDDCLHFRVPAVQLSTVDPKDSQ